MIFLSDICTCFLVINKYGDGEQKRYLTVSIKDGEDLLLNNGQPSLLYKQRTLKPQYYTIASGLDDVHQIRSTVLPLIGDMSKKTFRFLDIFCRILTFT